MSEGMIEELSLMIDNIELIQLVQNNHVSSVGSVAIVLNKKQGEE